MLKTIFHVRIERNDAYEKTIVETTFLSALCANPSSNFSYLNV